MSMATKPIPAFWYCNKRISCAPPVMKSGNWLKQFGVGSNKGFDVVT
jgi:hypothetical protein